MKWTLALLAVCISCALGCRPIWRMYESRGYGEDYVENAVELVSITDVFDVAEYGIDDYFPRTCPQGVWVGYEYAGYGGRSNVESNYVRKGGVLSCTYQNSGKVFQSLKLVGNPDDYTASAVVTWQQPGNEGGATTYLEDTEQFLNRNFWSFILMGNEEMEIFTGANYTGDSFCIGPNNGYISSDWQWEEKNHLRNGTELYTNLYDLDRVLGITDFNSFRFGCSSRK